MLKSPFKSVIARAATFALVLALGIAFVTVGLAPSASARLRRLIGARRTRAPTL